MDPIPSTPKQTNLYLLFAALVVLILLVLGYFFFIAKSPVPSEFFTLYQEQDSLTKKAESGIVFDYALLSKAIQTKDATNAATLAKQNLIQSLKNQESSTQIQKKTASLKIISGQVNDNTIREKIIKLIAQMDQRNTKLAAVIRTQTNIMTVLSNHFGALSVGMKETQMPQNIDAVIQASQSEVQAITNLQMSIDVAYAEIIKLSGVDPTISQTADSIRMSLSATPEKQPTLTDFPTPTPAPTLPPTPTQAIASDSATASSSAH